MAVLSVAWSGGMVIGPGIGGEQSSSVVFPGFFRSVLCYYVITHCLVIVLGTRSFTTLDFYLLLHLLVSLLTKKYKHSAQKKLTLEINDGDKG